MNEITPNNFKELLKAFLDKNKLSAGKTASAIGCSTATIRRILAGETQPSDEMMRQGGAMMEIGFLRYSKLSAAEKEKISEMIGTVSGGGVGFALITATVSTLGYTGLSAAGVTSGLTVLGGIIGGGMVAGIAVAAAIPIATAAAAYATVKGVKYAVGKYALGKEQINSKWEQLPACVGGNN